KRHTTGSGKPAEPGREDDDDDDRPEEFGDRDTEIGAYRDSVVEGTSVPQRRGDAETDPDDGDKNEGGSGQHHRAADRFHEKRPYRSVHQDRLAAIAAPEAAGRAHI